MTKSNAASSEAGLTKGSSTGGTSPRRLTDEEMQRSAQRLATITRHEVTLKPLVESAKLSKLEEEKSVKRLYEEAVAAQKRKHEDLVRRHDESTSPKHLSNTRTLAQGEEQEAVARLYEKSIQHKQLVAAELEKKFTPQPNAKRLEAPEQETVNTRLYGDSISKHRDGHTKLYEKYILDVAPKMAKRTTAELKANAVRLHAGDK